MTQSQAEEKAHPLVDPEHDRSENPFDETTSSTGQQYSREREEALGSKHPSGHPLIGDPTKVEAPTDDPQGRDIPPENGRRAWFDSKTGEVHGSGSGAGGGSDGEDFNTGTPGGS